MAKYDNLHTKTIFDICKDEKILEQLCDGYPKEYIINELGQSAINPNLISKYACLVNDEELLKAIDEQADILFSFGQE